MLIESMYDDSFHSASAGFYALLIFVRRKRMSKFVVIIETNHSFIGLERS